MFWKLLTIGTPVAYASIDTFVHKLNKFIFNPLIKFLFALAVVYFLYGLFEFIRDSGSEDGREKGKQHMLWGLIGLAIMVSVFFIMKVILGTIGIDQNQINVQTGEVNIQQ